MKTSNLQISVNNLADAQENINALIDSYFFAGNYEHQMALISNAIVDVINKGTNDTDESLDSDFEYTNRYIRESIYDLTELQKFISRLHIFYEDYNMYKKRLLKEAV